MTVQLLRRLLVATSTLLIVFPAAGLQPVKADSVPMTMDISAGGTGPGPSGPPNFGSVNETLTGTFQFDPATATVFNITLYGSGIVSEYWVFGPVFGTPTSLPGYDSFGWSGYEGSQGDVLNFAVVTSSDGGFVPASSGAILSGSAATSNLRSLDSWGGTITPAPEPTSCLLLGTGLAVLLIFAGQKRSRECRSFEWALLPVCLHREGFRRE